MNRMVKNAIIPTKHAHGDKTGDILVGIVIISDSLYKSKRNGFIKGDVSGNLCRRLLDEKGMNIKALEVVPDSVYEIRSVILRMINNFHLVITIGGTGTTPRDLTIEAIIPFVEKNLKGFEERFRVVSFPKIGNAVILTRTFLGIIGKTVICCLPGSPHAVKLGMEEVLLPDLRHLLKHVTV